MANVTTAVRDGVADVTLDAPPLNILTRALLVELRGALAALSRDDALRVVVLRGAGRHFSAGASVAEHLPGEYETMLDEFESTVLALHAFPLPVIAAVHGRCLGGGFELVQAADLVVAAEDAQFGQPEIQLGVMPPIACVLLAQWVGAARAAELLFTGDPLTAHDAARAGMVARVVTADALHAEAQALAVRIARHSAAALRASKRALRAARPDVADGVRAAGHIYRAELMTTHDALEGLQAFMQKRTPQWSHR